MGLIKAFSGAITSTIADQWKDIITAGNFREGTLVGPGLLKQTNNSSFNNATPGVITNGSKIFVPENTAAFIFSQGGISDVITESGGYTFTNGEDSVLSGGSFTKSILNKVVKRTSYGGQTDTEFRIAFVNLREIRNIKFGTRGTLIYHDMYYEVDLSVKTFGSFSIQIVDPEKFIRNFLPANELHYSINDKEVKDQLMSEFLHSLVSAINSLSVNYRISQIPSQADKIVDHITSETSNAGSWKSRFGFSLVRVGLESVDLSEDSQKMVNEFSKTRMQWKALDGVSQQASNITAQQKIAQGIQNHGLGDMPGMMVGMNVVNGMGLGGQAQSMPQTPAQPVMSLDEQMTLLKKLKALVDEGILTEEEFNIKKKELLNL